MADTREFTLHVPRNLNSGKRVSRSFLEALEERLTLIAGGFTRTRAIGGYRMSDGSVKREPVYAYGIVAAPRQVARLLSVAEHVKISLAQESVLLTSRDIDARFV